MCTLTNPPAPSVGGGIRGRRGSVRVKERDKEKISWWLWISTHSSQLQSGFRDLNKKKTSPKNSNFIKNKKIGEVKLLKEQDFKFRPWIEEVVSELMGETDVVQKHHQIWI